MTWINLVFFPFNISFSVSFSNCVIIERKDLLTSAVQATGLDRMFAGQGGVIGTLAPISVPLEAEVW